MVHKTTIVYQILRQRILAIPRYSQAYETLSSLDLLWRYSKISLLVLLSPVLVILTAVYTFIKLYLKVVFIALILWRDYRSYFNIPFMINIELFFDFIVLSFPEFIPGIQSIYSYIDYYFQVTTVMNGFVWLIGFLGSLTIDFSSIQINCMGATAPMELFLNIFILLFFAILIESNAGLFYATICASTHVDFRRLTQNSYAYRQIGWAYPKTFFYFLGSLAMSNAISIDVVHSILQYSVGFVNIRAFSFSFSGGFGKSQAVSITGGHAYSDVCNQVAGLENFDYLLAIISTVLAYVLIPVIIYNVSRLLITYQRHYIRRHTARESVFGVRDDVNDSSDKVIMASSTSSTAAAITDMSGGGKADSHTRNSAFPLTSSSPPPPPSSELHGTLSIEDFHTSLIFQNNSAGDDSTGTRPISTDAQQQSLFLSSSMRSNRVLGDAKNQSSPRRRKRVTFKDSKETEQQEETEAMGEYTNNRLVVQRDPADGETTADELEDNPSTIRLFRRPLDSSSLQQTTTPPSSHRQTLSAPNLLLALQANLKLLQKYLIGAFTSVDQFVMADVVSFEICAEDDLDDADELPPLQLPSLIHSPSLIKALYLYYRIFKHHLLTIISVFTSMDWYLLWRSNRWALRFLNLKHEDGHPVLPPVAIEADPQFDLAFLAPPFLIGNAAYENKFVDKWRGF